MLSLMPSSDKLYRFIIKQLHHITTLLHRIRSVANPSLELLELETIEKQKKLNEGNGSYQTLWIR